MREKDIVWQKATLFLVVILFLGLVPLFVDLLYKSLNSQKTDFYNYLQGGLLFFCSGIVASSALDIWLKHNVYQIYKKKNKVEYYIFFHIILPVFIFLIIAVTYLYISIGTNFGKSLFVIDMAPTNLHINIGNDFEHLIMINIIVFVLSVTYSTISRIEKISVKKYD